MDKIRMMKKVKDVMNENVVFFSPEDSIFDVAKLLAELDISGGPVVEKGKVVGIITLSDIIRYVSVKTFRIPKITNPSVSDLLLRILTIGKDQIQFMKELKRIKKIKVKDVMTKDVISIHPNADIIEAATLMEKHDVNRLPVIDGKGKLKGIIARADLIKAIVF